MSTYYFEFPYLKYYSSTMKYYSAIVFYPVEILEEEAGFKLAYLSKDS